jgi:hypothetical protein
MLGTVSVCGAQTNLLALITMQLDSPSVPLEIKKLPVPDAVVSQA